jgi:hypothetical protein
MSKSLGAAVRVALAASLAFGAPLAQAQDAPPNIDAAIDQLVQLNPAELAAAVKSLKEQSAAQAAAAAEAKAAADALDQQLVAAQTQVDQVLGAIKALGERFFPAPAAAPAEQQAAMMEAEAPKDFKNFVDHIQPIFAQHCARCHSEDNRKSGLALNSFALMMEGGSSGAVITPGDPDGSRLFRLITKAEEPVMPPSGDGIPADQLAIVREWIAAGAPMDKNSMPMAKKEEEAGTSEGGIYIAATFASTPPMPEAALAAAQPAGQRGVVARAMDASPTAPLMAVGALGQVLLYNTDTYELMGALPFPEGQVFTLTFSVNGERLLAGGGEEGDSGRAALFDVRTGERVGTYGDYYDTVLAADISPDHRMIALGGPNRKVRVYSVETGEELYMIDEHTEWVLSVKFTPDAEVLATADRGGSLFLWQAATGRYVEELKGHTGAIHALQYTYDSALLASAGNDGTVQIWDTWKYSRVRSFPAHGVPVLQLDINKAGQILTTGQDAAAKMFDIEGKELKAFSGLRDWGYSASFAHDGVKVMAGSWTGEIVMWSADTAEALATLGTMPVKTEG